MKSCVVSIAVIMVLLLGGHFAIAQSTTAFTFQGELTQNGNPANGPYDMHFGLYGFPAGGTLLGETTINGVEVVDGRFTVELDFGTETFNLFNQNRYLQVQVNGTSLFPRSAITRSPYALQTRGIQVNEDATFVGIGRDEWITPAEVFGLYRNTNDYAGMYVETENGGKPFYGYSTSGGTEAYHYYDDSSAVWRLNIFNEDRLNVAFNGNVGMGTTSPSAPLQVVEGSAGVAAHANSTAVFERSGQNFVSILSPNSSERGILFGDPESFVNGGIVYNNPSNPDGLQFRTGGNIDRMSINSAGSVLIDGKVGIGTDFATAPLTAATSTDNNAIRGINNSASGIHDGVSGVTQSPSGWGIAGANVSGGVAGGFEGHVVVIGNLSKSSGSFKIDHPLDPENKFLYHSFVESPDMMNIYNGNVTTDERGYATVVLPEWFEALNRDFRYQLTVIDDLDRDQFVLAKIVQQIEVNRFRIRTSAPATQVSWQVTGVRQDAYAEAYRIPVEAPKTGHEIGRYLHPEVFGLEREISISSSRRELMQQQLQHDEP